MGVENQTVTLTKEWFLAYRKKTESYTLTQWLLALCRRSQAYTAIDQYLTSTDKNHKKGTLRPTGNRPPPGIDKIKKAFLVDPQGKLSIAKEFSDVYVRHGVISEENRTIFIRNAAMDDDFLGKMRNIWLASLNNSREKEIPPKFNIIDVENIKSSLFFDELLLTINFLQRELPEEIKETQIDYHYGKICEAILDNSILNICDNEVNMLRHMALGEFYTPHLDFTYTPFNGKRVPLAPPLIYTNITISKYYKNERIALTYENDLFYINNRWPTKYIAQNFLSYLTHLPNIHPLKYNNDITPDLTPTTAYKQSEKIDEIIKDLKELNKLQKKICKELEKAHNQHLLSYYDYAVLSAYHGKIEIAPDLKKYKEWILHIETNKEFHEKQRQLLGKFMSDEFLDNLWRISKSN